MLPFGFNTDGHQGWHNDTNCFRSLDYILLTLKHISSLIQIRNELIVAVLKEDRGRILLITVGAKGRLFFTALLLALVIKSGTFYFFSEGF